MTQRFPGIRQSYPNLPILIGPTTRGLLVALRPFTFSAVLAGIVAMGALAVGTHATTWDTIRANWVPETFWALTLLPLQAASNLINQVADLTEDRVTKPYRPIVNGTLPPERALGIALLALVLDAGLFLLYPANGLFVGAFCLTLFSTLLYSIPPLRLKARTWLGNLAVALGRGFFGPIAAWAIFTDTTVPTLWIASGLLALYTFGAITSKDFADETGDRLAGNQTLVVRYGASRAAQYASLPVAATMLFLPFAGLHLWFPALLLAECTLLLFLAKLLLHDGRDARFLEGSRVWIWYYAGTLALFLAYASVIL